MILLLGLAAGGLYLLNKHHAALQLPPSAPPNRSTDGVIDLPVLGTGGRSTPEDIPLPVKKPVVEIPVGSAGMPTTVSEANPSVAPRGFPVSEPDYFNNRTAAAEAAPTQGKRRAPEETTPARGTRP